MSFLRVLARILSCKLMGHGFGTAYPYYLVFNVTHRCNSRCNMCFIWKTYLADPNLIKTELTASEIGEIFKTVPSPLWLTLSGGEAFLREDLMEICEVFHRCYPKMYGLGIPTNGLLTDRIVELTEEILAVDFRSFRVSVSIDGTRQINDQVRGIKGSYDKALATYHSLKMLAKEHPTFSVGLNWTITPWNMGDLENFCQLNDNIDDLSVSIAQTGHVFRNVSSVPQIDKETANSDIDFLLKNSRFPSLYGKIKRTFTRRCKTFLDNPHKMILPCSALTASCLIDPYGNLYPCTVWDRKVGSLREKSFMELWTSPEAKKIRGLIKKELCSVCWSGCESTHTILQNLHRVVGEFC